MTTLISGCRIPGCNEGQYCRGMCCSHYKKSRRYGDPNFGGRKYRTSEDAFSASTEWDGDCLVWRAATCRKGYGYIHHNGKTRRAHRYAWERVNGPIPPGMMIDHKCWNRACVNVDHLRLASPGQNASYINGARPSSVTGVRNVTRDGNRFRVTVKSHGVRYHGGMFATIEEAEIAAEKLRNDLFSEFSGRSLREESEYEHEHQ